VPYLAHFPVRLFLVHQPHQFFLIVINISALPDRRNETYGVGLQKPFAQKLIARRRDCNSFQGNLDITYLHKLSPKRSARLPLERDVMLAGSFKRAPGFEDLAFFILPTRRETPSSRIR